VRSRRLRIGVALGVVTAAAAAFGPSETPGAQVAGVRPCTTSQLKIRMLRSFVAAGNVGGYIGFVNRGNAPCRLTGWPTLVAFDPGTRTAVHVRSTMWGPHISVVPLVTLRPGKVAGAAFAAGDSPGPGKLTCPRSFRRLRVTPPANSRSAVLSAWLPALDAYLPACTRLNITMVVPRSDLRGA
jgi:Protein of unknown function (DUF4232)